MKVTQIEYRKLVTDHSSYSNTTIGAVAAVDEDEQPAAALASLEQWVEDHLQQRSVDARALAEKRHEKAQLDWQVGEMQARLERLGQQWREAKRILEAHGVAVEPVAALDEIPF